MGQEGQWILGHHHSEDVHRSATRAEGHHLLGEARGILRHRTNQRVRRHQEQPLHERTRSPGKSLQLFFTWALLGKPLTPSLQAEVLDVLDIGNKSTGGTQVLLKIVERFEEQKRAPLAFIGTVEDAL